MEVTYRVPVIGEFVDGFKYEVHEMTTGGYIILDNEDKDKNTHKSPDIKVYHKCVFGACDPLFKIPYHDLTMIESLLSSGQIRVESIND